MTDGSAVPRSRFHGRVARPEPTPCAAPGCPQPGEFRAPRSNRVPGSEGGWQWLCLDHVRAFNDRYNFFDGMSPEAIAEAQSPLAGWAHVVHDINGFRFNDPLNTLHGRFGEVQAARRTPSGVLLGDTDLKALATLGLDPTATLADIRRAYKAAVRRFHPDSNGGDRTQEGKLQEAVVAYTHLKSATAFARKA